MLSFEKIKALQNGDITLLFTQVCKSCPNQIFKVVNISLNAFRENKVLAKISEFTVGRTTVFWGGLDLAILGYAE